MEIGVPACFSIRWYNCVELLTRHDCVLREVYLRVSLIARSLSLEQMNLLVVVVYEYVQVYRIFFICGNEWAVDVVE